MWPGIAARLLGAASALRSGHGTPVPPSEQADNERTTALAGRALGDEAFASAWTRGQALSLEQAMAEARWMDEPAQDATARRR